MLQGHTVAELLRDLFAGVHPVGQRQTQVEARRNVKLVGTTHTETMAGAWFERARCQKFVAAGEPKASGRRFGGGNHLRGHSQSEECKQCGGIMAHFRSCTSASGQLWSRHRKIAEIEAT